MAYIKNNWVDREGTTRYFETVDSDGAKIFTPDYTQVTEMGTPVNSDNMNHIEEGIAAGSFTKYDNKTTYAKNDLVTTIIDNELKVYKSLQDNNTNALDNASFWEEVEFSGGSGTGLQMFDTILKDHVLTFEESKGLALQGTYVYKNAVAGSRYGYPDFYNKVVEEYQNSFDEQVYVKSNVTTTGAITDKEGVLTGFTGKTAFATLPAKVPTTSFELVVKLHTPVTFTANSTFIQTSVAYHGIILRVKNTAGDVTSWASTNGTSNNLLGDKATGITLPTDSDVWVKVSWDGAKYSFAYSLNNADWINGNSYESTAALSWTSPIALGGCDWESYPWVDGAIDINESYLDIDGERYWTGVETLEYKKNANGHLFYNISNKESVDTFFEKYGTAWFYGVDEENERVFLPRNNYFEQATGDSSEVGQSVKAGLPNVEGYMDFGEGFPRCSELTYTGALSGTRYSNAYAGFSGTSGYKLSDLTLDASKANDIYGNSDTVQPAAVKKLLYICVGNTESVSSVTDVVEVTTTENDTIPLFTAQYFDFTPNNVSWLKAGQQANSGDIYTTCYNELVNELTSPKYGLKVINEADMVGDVDYSEYWKVNQDNMTFTTPTAISNKALSGAVVGNGMTLGLTNGTTNVGFVVGNALGTSIGAYGADIGTPSSGSGLSNSNIGVTTDPTKSGIIAEQATAQLYFKVGNAVQNLELLDAGEVLDTLANKVDINSNIIDGQWVVSFLELTTSTAAGSVTLDLSTYLPNDGQIYDVKITCYSYETAEASTTITTLGSDIIPEFNILRSGGQSRTNTQVLDLPVGTARTITVNHSASLNAFILSVLAYRRIGTNV